MTSVEMITQEYVMKYIETTNATIEKLTAQIVALENHKSIMTERNEHLVFRLTSAEHRIADLNNTLMNHFAYKKPVVPATHSLTTLTPTPTPSPVQAPSPFNFEFAQQRDIAKPAQFPEYKFGESSTSPFQPWKPENQPQKAGF